MRGGWLYSTIVDVRCVWPSSRFTVQSAWRHREDTMLPQDEASLTNLFANAQIAEQLEHCWGKRIIRVEKRPFHAKNKIAGLPNYTFSILGFWDKNIGICAGAMPYRRDFSATTKWHDTRIEALRFRHIGIMFSSF